MAKFRLYIYDVCGNPKDGFDVNDIWRTDTAIEVNDDTSDRAINRRLNAKGITWSASEAYESGTTIWGYSKKHGNAVGELRSID